MTEQTISKYFAAWEISPRRKDDIKKVMLTQGLTENASQLFQMFGTFSEWKIEKDKVKEVLLHSSDGVESEDIRFKLPIQEWQERDVFFMTKENDGPHSIGGVKPDKFTAPSSDTINTPFIHIATINGDDDHFRWLGVSELHISYPLYAVNYGLYLDYSDRNKPIVMNPDNLENILSDNENVTLENLYFEKVNYKTDDSPELVKSYMKSDDTLLCGVPWWYQYPDIPECPKTGEPLEFVCCIKSNKNIKVANFKEYKDCEIDSYFVIGDYWNLYVFYNPKSKVMYLTVQ